MKEWIKQWLGTPTLYDPAKLFDKLQEAQAQHISDLRVLIDKGNEREAALVSIVQQSVSQGRMQRVNPADRTENPVAPAIAPEHLSDVATFDEEADAADLSRHDEKTKELQAEFASIFAEQATEGITKP